jgi:Glycosyl transferase family 2
VNHAARSRSWCPPRLAFAGFRFDNSPDGTGAIADELAAADDHIFVLHRAGKEGLGAAYVVGFAWAKDKGST